MGVVAEGAGVGVVAEGAGVGAGVGAEGGGVGAVAVAEGGGMGAVVVAEGGGVAFAAGSGSVCAGWASPSVARSLTDCPPHAPSAAAPR